MKTPCGMLSQWRTQCAHLHSKVDCWLSFTRWWLDGLFCCCDGDGLTQGISQWVQHDVLVTAEARTGTVHQLHVKDYAATAGVMMWQLLVRYSAEPESPVTMLQHSKLCSWSSAESVQARLPTDVHVSGCITTGCASNCRPEALFERKACGTGPLSLPIVHAGWRLSGQKAALADSWQKHTP